MRIGIFGGTFDPPHCGHVYVASKLRRFLRFDEVWWVVTEANHLKPTGKYSYRERVLLVRKLIAKHPGMRLKEVPSSRAYDVVKHCRRRYPTFRFVWLGGSDNMEQIHRWFRWRDFCALLPMVFLARPGSEYASLYAPFSRAIPRVRTTGCQDLHKTRIGAWMLVRTRMWAVSSTLIRSSESMQSECK